MFSAVSNTLPDFVIQGNPLNKGERLVVNRNQSGEAYLLIMGLDTEKLLDHKLCESEVDNIQLILPESMGTGTYIVILHQKGHRVTKKLIVR